MLLCGIFGPFHIVILKRLKLSNRAVTVHLNTLIEQSENALQAISRMLSQHQGPLLKVCEVIYNLTHTVATTYIQLLLL